MKNASINERIKALTAQVEAGVKGVYESDNYRKYLMAMSKFHIYSARNTLLILLQCPDATHVAGYNAWRDRFNRHVRRGEKGISILGYTPRTVETIREKRDGDGKTVVGPDGKPEVERAQIKVPAFTPVYVFDVSQTEGDPLPQLVNALEGTVNGYKKLMAAMERVAPYPIHFEEIRGAARGICDHVSGRIVIQQGMSEAQTVKTAIHEIAHAHLHGPNSDRDRAAKEVEAESVAFVVCDHYGLDTSDYSFPYLASWSSGKELAELTASLDTIQRKAFELIEGIDAQLQELSMVREEPALDGETKEAPASLPPEGHSVPTAGVEPIPVETYTKTVEAAKAAHMAAAGIISNEAPPASKAIVGIVTWANGETEPYLDAKQFLSVVTNELPYRSTSGFAFYNLSSEPAICKALDDLVYGEFGEENPNDMPYYEEHAALASRMNALGFERTYEPGFSKDFMMWKETETGRTFGLDYWPGVKDFLQDHEVKERPKHPDRPRSIKEVMASAQARADARAAARAEERSQSLDLDGRGGM